MKVTVQGGDVVEIRRRWLPWDVHTDILRRIVAGSWGEPVDHSGPDGLVTETYTNEHRLIPGPFFLWLAMVIVVGAVVALMLAGEALVLVLLGVPLFAGAAFLGAVPWTVEVRSGKKTLETRRVRGWRASADQISELASSFQSGVRRLETDARPVDVDVKVNVETPEYQAWLKRSWPSA